MRWVILLVVFPTLSMTEPGVAQEPLRATAELFDAEGARVGSVTLRETPTQGVLLEIRLTGLEPGLHGFHIHETGRCAPAFSEAGGHFAPRGRDHGLWSPGGRHAGDLLNVAVASDGTASVERLAPGVTLHEGPAHSLFDEDGSAIVVHGGPDDYVSQPSGAAGGRVACGVVTR
jgi:Cu-Zn family superoxide dismutase